VHFKVEKLNVPFIDFEDLIKNKIASGRYKNVADVEQLQKNKKIANGTGR
jgi:hypothetical protein